MESAWVEVPVIWGNKFLIALPALQKRDDEKAYHQTNEKWLNKLLSLSPANPPSGPANEVA